MAENSDAASAEPVPTSTHSQTDETIAWVDGVNGSAGHELEDPHLRELLRQQLSGEITGDEYLRLGMEHLRRERLRQHDDQAGAQVAAQQLHGLDGTDRPYNSCPFLRRLVRDLAGV